MSDVSYSDDLNVDCTWWNATSRGKHPHDILAGLIATMRRRQSTLSENTRKCISVFQWGGDSRLIREPEDPPLEEATNSYNHAQNVVETVHAKICKTRILPMPLTSGGGYLARHRAKQLGKALEGEFDENELDQIKEDVVMDALVTAHGAGAVKVFARDGRARIEHVPVEDVMFDDAETRYRKPTCCYLTQPYDKFKLLEDYGSDDDEYPGLYGTPEERRHAILRSATKATLIDGRVSGGSDAEVHQVLVYEAWHKASCDVRSEEGERPDDDGEEDGAESTRKPRHDGRHVIAIDGCTLVDEPWDGETFPIIFYTPRPRRRSIWGLSMMFDLVAPQREYERLTAKIQNAHQKLGLSGLIAPKQAKVNPREFESGVTGPGFVAEYEGQVPPTPFVTSPVAPDVYAYKDSIPRDMMQSEGISQLSAQSQVPAGLSQASGKALQVFEDFESERLLPYHRALERFTIQLSWVLIDVIRGIVATDEEYQVQYRGKHGTEKLMWRDVLMDRKDFVLKIFPVSQLSKQPAARFAQLTELLNAQAITVEQFKRLYELPDLEAENEIDTADTDIIDRNLDIIVTTGRYLSPEPFDNLDLLIQRAGKFYNLCRANEVPEARLQLLRNLIEDAKNLKTPPPPPPGMVAPGLPPPEMPMDPGMPPPPPDGGAPPGMPPGPPPPMPMVA